MDWNNFENHLKNHDWFYQYSDDHRVWKSGVNSENILLNEFLEAKSENNEKALSLWNKYAPDVMVKKQYTKFD